MSGYADLKSALSASPKAWLLTGVAGFIGSHLLETLLHLDQHVLGLDNFATGKKENLDEVKAAVRRTQWQRFHFVAGDIRCEDTCQTACEGVDYVLHQAALASVPLSLEDPSAVTETNVRGTLNLLLAARDHRVKRMVYASSCAVYGDDPTPVKSESVLGGQLSPYAVTKLTNELYAQVFGRCYGLETVGLRYFNVFGPRQDPEGPYAAVIPKWITALIQNEPVVINGDGKTSRDFCHVANVVHANLLAATCSKPEAINGVFNVGLGEQNTLNELFEIVRSLAARDHPELRDRQPIYQDFRPGDVRHSQGDISRARRLLGYAPELGLAAGLEAAFKWYKPNLTPSVS